MPTTDADAAKAEAWRVAKLLAQGDRGLASVTMHNAELDVIRKLLCLRLAGGEAEYWRMIAKELEQ
jgi:hypothetical protein